MSYIPDIEIDLEADLAIPQEQAYSFLTRGSAPHMGIVKAPLSDIPRVSANTAEILRIRRQITQDRTRENLFTSRTFSQHAETLNAFSKDLFSKTLPELPEPYSDDALEYGLSLWAEYAEEDIFVLESDGTEAVRLIAGHTCFPSRWNPLERIGESLFELHGPVPELGKLPKMIHAFFQRIPLGEAFYRMNWSLTDDPDWHQPTIISRYKQRVADGVAPQDAVYYRVEKQHVVRLSDALWIFLVNVRQIPLRQVAENGAVFDGLRKAVLGWSEAKREYSSFHHYGESFLRSSP